MLYSNAPHRVDERGSYGRQVQERTYNQLLNTTHRLLQQGKVPTVREVLAAAGVATQKLYAVFGTVHILRATACSEWLDSFGVGVSRVASRRSLEGAVHEFVVALCSDKYRGYILCLQELWREPGQWLSLREELEKILHDTMFAGGQSSPTRSVRVRYHLDALLAMIVRDEATPESIRWSVRAIAAGTQL